MRTGSPPVIIVGEPRQELGRDRELGFWGVGWEDGRSGETRKRNGRGQQTRPNVPNTKGLANLRWALVGLWLFEADPVWLGAACRGELHWSVCCPCAGKRACNWVPEAADPAQPRVPRQAQHVKSHFWMHWCEKWTTTLGLCCSQVRDWPCLAHTSTLLDCHSWLRSLVGGCISQSGHRRLSAGAGGKCAGPGVSVCQCVGTCEHASAC